MKYSSWLKKPVALETGIFFAFLSLFLLLNWRLFAFGSENQLFLYGDNLSTLNNLFYIFSHFNFWNPFETLIGQNGMMGSYLMAEPQNSVFYLPITLALVLYKAFHLDAIGLYYELLALHTVHFLIGVFFIYKISHRILALSRPMSFIGGLVYLGLGWNAAWFGTATLSYMIGILPLVFYIFFRYLQTKEFRTYILFVLSLALFLYAGGIVNFFFYLLLNFFLVFTAFVFLKYDRFFSYESQSEIIKQYVLLFIVAPFLSLLAYSVQLFTTYQVSADISHSSSDYDYLAFFGSHFYDLIGVLVPKFGLMQFGSVTNPQIILEYSLANILYVGFLPLLVVILGIFAVKSREILLFVFMIVINLILSFGGAFFLYDATYFFPGNEMFRGHYKYLMFVGIYISLIVPFVLHCIRAKEFDVKVYEKIGRYAVRYIFMLVIFAIILSFATFAFKVLQKGGLTFLAAYYPIAITFSSYFLRMILIGILSLLVLKFFVGHARGIAMAALALILLVDTSVNFKYGMYYETPIQDLVSDTFFENIERKTVINDIDKYTQLYHIPEIVGVDAFFQYSAIPNRYLAEYNGYLKNSDGSFRQEILRAAGIDGVISNSLLADPAFELDSSKSVNEENYTKLYAYNANGDIHNDWGKNGSLIGQTIRYYALNDTKKAYFTNDYSQEKNEKDLWDKMLRNDFSEERPFVLVDKKEKRNILSPRRNDVSFLENRPIFKKFELHNGSEDGLFFINIPYSSIWKAKVNGNDAEIHRTNYAFSGVKVKEKDAVVEMYVETTKYTAFLGISTTVITLLIGLLFIPAAWLRKTALLFLAAMKNVQGKIKK